MPKVKFLAKDFIDMVANLPAAKLDSLYDSHWTCQAIFRSLPSLAKMYVLRLLYIEVAVVGKVLEEWILPDFRSKHKIAMDRLEQLRLILLVSERKREPSYKLNPKFQKQLRHALTSGGGPPREPLSSSIAVRLPTSAELDSYAMKQWEGVLLQLVSAAFPDSTLEPQNPFIIQTFQRAGLLARGGESSNSKLTEAGFQFLLMDTNFQLWQIVREYISAAEDRGINNVDLIRFLLELGFHLVGEPYSVNTLTGTEQQVLEELAVLGLVQLQQGMRERWFIPTKLAANLATSHVSSRCSVEQGVLIVETNFRLYAYTASKLQTQILRLFARIEYQLPNLVVGALNKESVNTAFASGISAEQIISYLQHNAHPHVAQKVPSVPETVADQIRLWESDSKRVQYIAACFYDDFPSMEIYESVHAYARDRNGLIWQDDSKRSLVVQGHLHEEMRTFIRNQSNIGSEKK